MSSVIINNSQYMQNNNLRNSNISLERLTQFKYNSEIYINDNKNYVFKQFLIKNVNDINNSLKILYKYFSAFLNTNDGIIYLGITDRGKIEGIKLSDELKNKFAIALNDLICGYDKHIQENQNIIYFFYNIVTDNPELLLEIQNKYVIEIIIKKGLPDRVYTTPKKEEPPVGDDYGCYIKLNGCVRKLLKDDLYNYTKNKIQKYVKSLMKPDN